MNRCYYLLTLVLGSVLTAGAAADDLHGPFAEGLLGLGAGVGDSVAVTRPTGADPAIVVVDGQSVEPQAAGNRIERLLGEFLVRNDDARPIAETTAQPGPRRFPEATGPAETPAVGIEHMLSGDDLGNHNRVHEFLVRRPPPEPAAAVAPESVVAADYFTDLADEAATVQLTDDQLPPPPPPTAPMTPEISPEADGMAPPFAAPTGTSAHLSAGYIDPRYQSSGEDSIYTSTCERCGRTYCRCVYAPFGDAIRSAFGQQVHLGSAALMTLYAYDFHLEGTSYQSQLTARGEHQLDKIVSRLQYTPSRIKVEASGDAVLDEARRLRVLESLEARGIADADAMVVTVRTGNGRPAIELLESSDDLLESIRQRGRTIRAGGSATFSGGGRFGQ